MKAVLLTCLFNIKPSAFLHVHAIALPGLVRYVVKMHEVGVDAKELMAASIAG